MLTFRNEFVLAETLDYGEVLAQFMSWNFVWVCVNDKPNNQCQLIYEEKNINCVFVKSHINDMVYMSES